MIEVNLSATAVQRYSQTRFPHCKNDDLHWGNIMAALNAKLLPEMFRFLRTESEPSVPIVNRANDKCLAISDLRKGGNRTDREQQGSFSEV